jgi:hypothetical protein
MGAAFGLATCENTVAHAAANESGFQAPRIKPKRPNDLIRSELKKDNRPIAGEPVEAPA